jgi:hypothetical protein
MMTWISLVEPAIVWKTGGVCHEWKLSFWINSEMENNVVIHPDNSPT